MMRAIVTLCLLTAALADVSCGGHSAATCADCPQGNGAAWCNGECTWENNACVVPSLMCTPTIQTSSCADCPSGEEGCTGADCFYNPSTGLCRDQLSNEVRTASVHLNYPAPVSRPTWWFQRVQVTDSSSVSYHASNGHGLGYGGLQQVTADPFQGKVLFSLWDQGCDQDVNPSCDPGTLATVVACGEGVTCEGFGGEGTGKKSWFYFNSWSLEAPYYMVTHAQDMGGGRVRYSGYFRTDEEWRFLATFEVNGGTQWWLRNLYSFVEQWSPENTDQTRAALYGPSFMLPESADAASCPTWTQVQSATFSYGTAEPHHQVNAWQEDGKVGIATGGDAATNPRFAPQTGMHTQFIYPTASPDAALTDFAARMGCLVDSGEDDSALVAACLAAAPDDPLYQSCTATTPSPPLPPPPPSLPPPWAHSPSLPPSPTC